MSSARWSATTSVSTRPPSVRPVSSRRASACPCGRPRARVFRTIHVAIVEELLGLLDRDRAGTQLVDRRPCCEQLADDVHGYGSLAARADRTNCCRLLRPAQRSRWRATTQMRPPTTGLPRSARPLPRGFCRDDLVASRRHSPPATVDESRPDERGDSPARGTKRVHPRRNRTQPRTTAVNAPTQKRRS
jgi:hypothetical protein